MKIQLALIGNELLKGLVKDQNLTVLAELLAAEGLVLSKVAILGDDLDTLQKELAELYYSGDLLICSGGLGPTPDDCTQKAVAAVIEKPILACKKAMALARKHYARKNKTLPLESPYSNLPSGALPLENPEGMAPGIYFREEKRSIMALPGVPREWRAMIGPAVKKYLEDTGFRKNALKTLMIRTEGLPEEKIFGKTHPHLWDQIEDKFGAVSSLPQVQGVDITIALKNSPNATLEAVQGFIRDEYPNLNKRIWQWGALPLEELLIDLAKEKNITLSLAESCTGGLVANHLTNIAGSSAVFMGGVVSYSNSSKQKILGVDKEVIEQHGAVSAATAQAMALGALNQFETDLALSLTGIAGPGGGTEEKPVGTVYMGFAKKEKGKAAGNAEARHFRFYGGRMRLKESFGQRALFYLYQQIKNYS